MLNSGENSTVGHKSVSEAFEQDTSLKRRRQSELLGSFRRLPPYNDSPIDAGQAGKQRRLSKHVADQCQRRIAEHNRGNARAIGPFDRHLKTGVFQRWAQYAATPSPLMRTLRSLPLNSASRRAH